MPQLKIKFLSNTARDVYENGKLLCYQTAGSSGFDIRAISVLDPITKELKVLGEDIEDYTINPMERVCVNVGFAVGGVPDNYEIQVRPRSGLAAKNGVTVLNTPGTIDSDYRGELKIILINLGKEAFVVNNGERIAQIIVSPVTLASFTITDSLSDTSRGEKGFGSTGV